MTRPCGASRQFHATRTARSAMESSSGMSQHLPRRCSLSLALAVPGRDRACVHGRAMVQWRLRRGVAPATHPHSAPPGAANAWHRTCRQYEALLPAARVQRAPRALNRARPLMGPLWADQGRPPDSNPPRHAGETQPPLIPIPQASPLSLWMDSALRWVRRALL